MYSTLIRIKHNGALDLRQELGPRPLEWLKVGSASSKEKMEEE
jgi:hypothetical protein